MNKKKIIIIVAIMLVSIVTFAIYWNVTEEERCIKSELRKMERQVTSAAGVMSFTCYDDPRTEELAITLVKGMFENDDMNSLFDFIYYLEEREDYHSQKLASTLNEQFNAYDDWEYLYRISNSRFNELEFYKPNIVITRNTGSLADYIDEHGTKPFTTTPGEGYYANEEDTYNKEVIGIPGSPLYDVDEVVHMGDFKCYYQYGVMLDTFYQETSYSRFNGQFRGTPINFSPKLGELIWSGDYMFCFDATGNLINYCNISDAAPPVS